MFEFKLPDLGEGVHEGEILHWYVSEGDQIKADDPLVEVETDKAAVTIPSPKGGKVLRRTGQVGETISVGAVLVVIEDNGTSAASATRAPVPQVTTAPPAAAPAQPAAQPKPAPAVRATPVAVAPAPRPAPAAAAPSPPAPAPLREGPIPAAPATRRLARELGVELRSVPASGPGGRVTSEDVQRFAELSGTLPAAGETRPTAAAAPAAEAPMVTGGGAGGIPFLEVEPLPDFTQWGEVEREPMRSIRRKVAHKMVTSMILVPHVAHMDEADVTELDAFRRRERTRREGQPGARLTFLPFVFKAVISQLRAFPKFNASVDPFTQEIVYKRYYNLGFAADTEKGLVVPVLHRADQKSILRISAELADLSERARAGKLEVGELRGGTFTVTNVGSLGGTGMIPTINYPEVAILGMGMAQDKPVARDGQVVIRKMLPLTLAFDHRIIDGADAARFVTAVVRQLSDPSALLVEG